MQHPIQASYAIIGMWTSRYALEGLDRTRAWYFACLAANQGMMLTLPGGIISSKSCIVQTYDEIHSEVLNFQILPSETSQTTKYSSKPTILSSQQNRDK